ncbi:GW dipeptide domain-containing protein [Enterococcus sp. CWB-B31]|uniref:GW dipeptide domain-containing protein n=1 Tax=Enterococcus sp. CWB-B31 TaxID=2885159 RepID=UPI001E3D5357|nr:GW dipeptide domain-containing protein [Enterococcus sp. CWB-B31]MCB5956206.1 GW dipeptide domain-containing protein [Enterococcus sp. CWB-B31]
MKKIIWIALIITITIGSVSFSNQQVSAADTAIGDDYPSVWKNAPMNQYIDTWGYYSRNCTSFVANRLSKTNKFEIPRAIGNADVWGTNARKLGYTVDINPVRGSVAWWSSMHVAWVAAVDGDRVLIEEYNYGFTGKYNSRWISKGSVSGYIHFKDVPSKTFDTVKTQYNVSRDALIITSAYNEYGNVPYNTENYKKLGFLSGSVGKKVAVKQVVVTSANNKVYQFVIDGKTYWADYRNFATINATLKEETMNFSAIIKPSQYDEYGDNAYNSLEYRKIGSTQVFSGKEATISKKVTAKNGDIYYQFKIDGKTYWSDYRNFQPRDIISKQIIASGRQWKIVKSAYNEYGPTPYNTAGYKRLGYLTNYEGQKVKITKMVTTSANNTVYEFTLNGVVYWADYRNFEDTNKIIEDVSYNTYATISPSQYDEYGDTPYNKLEYKKLGSTTEFKGKEVLISSRVKAQSGDIYYKFTINGASYWSDYRNFSIRDTINQTTFIDNEAKIIASDYHEYGNVPYNTVGYTKLGYLTDHVGKVVSISKIVTTARNNILYEFKLNGVTYWADKRNFKLADTVAEETTINKDATIISSIYNEYGPVPYNTKGYKKLGTLASNVGKRVTVIKRVKTSANNIVCQYSLNGTTYWADYRNFKIDE